MSNKRVSRKRWLTQILLHRMQTKASVFLLLGNACNRCGTNDQRVLQLDHIEKFKGPQNHTHRRGWGLMYGILNGSVPWLLIQLLCANCHQIKTFENNECAETGEMNALWEELAGVKRSDMWAWYLE